MRLFAARTVIPKAAVQSSFTAHRLRSQRSSGFFRACLNWHRSPESSDALIPVIKEYIDDS